jgi:hypothetical protein
MTREEVFEIGFQRCHVEWKRLNEAYRVGDLGESHQITDVITINQHGMDTRAYAVTLGRLHDFRQSNETEIVIYDLDLEVTE